MLPAGLPSQEHCLYGVRVKSLDEAPQFDFRSYDRLDAGGYLDRIRQESTVARVPGGAMVIGHDAVQRLLSDRSLLSPVRTFFEMQGLTGGLVHQRLGQTLLAIDGPDHDRVRSIIRKAFVPSAVARYRPVMHSVIAGLVEPLQTAGGCEFMSQVADHYPIKVMCHVLGVPDEDHGRFAAWIGGIGWALTMELASHRDEIESSMSALDRYVGELLADRRARPRDDLVSELSVMEQQGDRLSEDELRSLIIGLLFAGHDTTRNQLGLAVWLFSRHPDQWELLASEPDRVNNAVEEVMRFLGSVAAAPRLTADAMELGGYSIPAGTLLMLSTASANHDTSAFANPHTFDITATRAPQLTFGGGPHYCLGAHLARAEMAEALKVLPRAFRNLRLDGDPEWRPPMNIWGPERLPVSYDSQAWNRPEAD